MAELSKGAAVGFTMLPQRSLLSVTGGSILAPVSNSNGRDNFFSKLKAVRSPVYDPPKQQKNIQGLAAWAFEPISEFPWEQNRQKKFLKKFMLGRDLVISIKLAQFLTHRAHSGIPIDSECYRECREQKKLKKEVKKIQGRGRDLGVI